MELEWQREVIEKWLNTPGIPLDARTGLVEMLRGVKEEMERLEAASQPLSRAYKPAAPADNTILVDDEKRSTVTLGSSLKFSRL